MFGNLGLSETVVILGIALIVFGPRRLPEIGRMLGKAMAQFRKAAADLKDTVEREVDASELKQVGESLKQARDTAHGSVWKALETVNATVGAGTIAPASPADQLTAEPIAEPAPPPAAQPCGVPAAVATTAPAEPSRA